jgi:hypothetical protein
MRIVQSATFLPSLLADVKSGRMMPAAMQRPYQWDRSDVEALCDSILSGFPVGGMLMWQPEDKADLSKIAKTRLGPISLSLDGEKWKTVALLLDGQHRLATLAWLMLEGAAPALDYSPSEHMFLGNQCLVLDLASQSMKFVSHKVAKKSMCLPAWTVMSGVSTDIYQRAMKLLREMDVQGKEGVEEMADLFGRASEAFGSARVTLTVIVDATPEEAKHAFLRICRTGVPMSEADFDRATAWAAA